MRIAGAALPLGFYGTGSMIDHAREHEQQVGEAVDVSHQHAVDGWSQRHHPALRPAADRPGHVQRRTRGTPARQNETPERRQLGFEPIDQLLEPRHIVVAKHGFRDPGGELFAGIGQLRAEREQIALEVNQLGLDLRVGAGRTRQTDAGIQLVHFAVCVNARVVFFNARAVKERCFTAVAGACVDLQG
jgi:hypothetical protein